MKEDQNNWEKEFDSRFTDATLDFRYKGDRDSVKSWMKSNMVSKAEMRGGWVKESRPKVERIDRYIFDDLEARLNENI